MHACAPAMLHTCRCTSHPQPALLPQPPTPAARPSTVTSCQPAFRRCGPTTAWQWRAACWTMCWPAPWSRRASGCSRWRHCWPSARAADRRLHGSGTSHGRCRGSGGSTWRSQGVGPGVKQVLKQVLASNAAVAACYVTRVAASACPMQPAACLHGSRMPCTCLCVHSASGRTLRGAFRRSAPTRSRSAGCGTTPDTARRGCWIRRARSCTAGCQSRCAVPC